MLVEADNKLTIKRIILVTNERYKESERDDTLKSDFAWTECTLHRVVQEDLFEAQIVKLRKECWEANHEKNRRKTIPGNGNILCKNKEEEEQHKRTLSGKEGQVTLKLMGHKRILVWMQWLKQLWTRIEDCRTWLMLFKKIFPSIMWRQN